MNRSRRLLAVLVLFLLANGLAWSAGQTESGAQSGEVVQLTVELFDRNNTPASEGTLEDNRWTQWIQEEMLKQGVEVEYFPVPRGEEQAKLNVLMGSGSAPDIVFTYNRFLFAQYALDGGLNDLSESLEAHGPYLYEYVGENVLDYGVLDGKQYAVPARRANTTHRTSWIRSDWLDALGLPMPTNREELFETLVAFKEQDPGGIGSENVIPYGYISPDSADAFEPHSFRQFNPMYSFMENDRDLMYTTPWPMRDGFREFAQWMNELYQAGLIDPEFATETDQLAQQKMINGQVGFFNWAHWEPYKADGIIPTLRQTVPGADFVPIEVFQNEAGDYPKVMYPPVGLYIMNPATSDASDAVVKYLNWMAEPDVAWTMSYGIEGEHYEMMDRAPMPIDPDYNRQTMGYVMGDLRIVYNGPPPSVPEEISEALILANNPLGEEYIEAMNIAAQDGFHEIVFNEELTEWSKYGPEIVRASDEYWVRMIMDEDFDAAYEEYMEQLEARGIDAVLAEREAYFEEYFE